MRSHPTHKLGLGAKRDSSPALLIGRPIRLNTQLLPGAELKCVPVSGELPDPIGVRNVAWPRGRWGDDIRMNQARRMTD